MSREVLKRISGHAEGWACSTRKCLPWEQEVPRQREGLLGERPAVLRVKIAAESRGLQAGW